MIHWYILCFIHIIMCKAIYHVSTTVALRETTLVHLKPVRVVCIHRKGKGDEGSNQ